MKKLNFVAVSKANPFIDTRDKIIAALVANNWRCSPVEEYDNSVTVATFNKNALKGAKSLGKNFKSFREAVNTLGFTEIDPEDSPGVFKDEGSLYSLLYSPLAGGFILQIA